MKRKRTSRRGSDHGSLLPTDSVVDALGQVELPADEVAAFVDALSQRHHSVLRCRQTWVDRQEFADALPFDSQSIPWYRLGRRVLDDQVRPSRCLAYATADYYLQDAGSLLALAVAGCDQSLTLPTQDSGGPLVCDLCASPGGKASALLESIGQFGFLLANEPIRSRIAPLAFNLARTGSDRFAISSLDPEPLADAVGGVFDLVLVDAPCSGQALLGRGKQSVSALAPHQIAHSAARQQRILAAAVRLLKPGGRLVYSTCTFAEAENESQIQMLVDDQLVRSAPIDSLSVYASGESTYRLWPHRHACAGSFAASAESTMDTEPARLQPLSKKREPRQKLPFELSDWYDVTEEYRTVVADSVAYAWPVNGPEWLESFASVHWLMGPEVAHRTGQTWKPSHAAALRRGTSLIGQQVMDTDAAAAKQFLSGAPISSQQTGWQVVRYDSKPLGWIKGSVNRAGIGTGKNQLPTAARFSGELSC